MSADEHDPLEEAPTGVWVRPDSAEPVPAPPHGDVLTACEVAAILRVDRKTVYEFAGRGEIPHRRLGKRLVFSRAALLEWLACKPASKE